MNEQNLFRLGGIYKQRNGVLVRLALASEQHEGRDCGVAMHLSGDCDEGWRFLSDGKYVYEIAENDTEVNLIPGEVNEQGEPITSKPCEPLAKPTTLGDLLRRAAEKLERSTVVIGVDLAAEPLRDPLPSLNAGPFDAFKDLGGWTVTVGQGRIEPTPVHALQRLAEGDPRCGSAWLLGR